MAPSKLSLKLLIDKKGQRVLFAEAGKDFVDFLFSLLTLPIGTVLSLVGNKHMNGSLPKLYQSVSNLDTEYIKSGQKKHALLNPTPSLPFDPPQVPLLPIKEWSCSSKPEENSFNASPPFGFTFSSASSTATPTLYKCGACKSPMLSNTYGSRCTYNLGFGGVCGREMTTLLADYVTKSQGDTPGGFVKGLVTYMVADDLSVSPMSMSTILNISLLNKFNIKDLDAVEEKVVQIGMDEGRELLRQSLNSNTVLTNVFLARDTATKVENPQEV